MWRECESERQSRSVWWKGKGKGRGRESECEEEREGKGECKRDDVKRELMLGDRVRENVCEGVRDRDCDYVRRRESVWG